MVFQFPLHFFVFLPRKFPTQPGSTDSAAPPAKRARSARSAPAATPESFSWFYVSQGDLVWTEGGGRCVFFLEKK